MVEHELDFSRLDIVAEVERHTATKLHPSSPSGKQWVGACPFDDCAGDDDGFMVWPELTSRNCHYYCRNCRRAGNVVGLVSKIKAISYREACVLLELTASDTPLPKRKLPVNDRQAQELAILTNMYPLMQRGLRHQRAQAYLAQRGVPLELAASLGLGYIPSFSTLSAEEITPDLRKIQRWCDRIVFPLQSKQCQGFTGRSLYLWEPGLDENEHKRRLDDFNRLMIEEHGEKDGVWRQIPRWKTTNPAGYFHTEILETCERVIVMEGPFDACAAIAGGIVDVLATCGTSIDVGFIPARICDAILAYDGDKSGEKAAADWLKALKRKGIVTTRCTPPDDGKGKDWSERYRLYGAEGLTPLLQLVTTGQWTVDTPRGDGPGSSVSADIHTDVTLSTTTVEIEHVLALASVACKHLMYWCVPDEGLFPAEQVTPDDYCTRLRTCLESDDPEVVLSGLEALAWQRAYLAKQIERPGARLPVKEYERELAALKARLDFPSEESSEGDCQVPTCVDCGAPASDQDRDFFFVPTSSEGLACYCTRCRNRDGQPIQAKEAMTKERLTQIAGQIAAAIPGGCSVVIEPRCTLAEHVKRLEDAERVRLREVWARPQHRREINR